MDYDNDGISDMISGSYDPGDLYLFRGLGDGEYAAAETISDESGLSLVHHPVEFAKWSALDKDDQNSGGDVARLRVASFGSWPAMVDWEGDGDVDVLIGSFAGDVYLRTNKGTRDNPVYDAAAIQIEADGKPMHVNMHAAPVVADWDADGLWDLVTGSGDGAVVWFRNVGTIKAPEFEACRQLVWPASDYKFFEQDLEQDEAPSHGTRAQICVVDYNGDGKLDLILGDHSVVNRMRDLTEREKSECAELLQKQRQMVALATRLRKQFAKDYKNEAFQQELKDFQEVFERLEDKRKSFFEETHTASFVWLFLRQEAVGKSAAENSAAMPTPNDTSCKHTDDVSGHDDASTDQLSLLVSTRPVEASPGHYELTVTIIIKPGWHLYSDVPKGSTHQVTEVKLKLPDGVSAAGDWSRLPGFPSMDNPAEKIYTEFAVFSRILRSKKGASPNVEVVVDYEVCNEDYCLPPDQLRQTITLEP